MYDKLLALWIRFRHNDEGVTLVEYGVAVAVAVGVGVAFATGIVGNINDAMTAAGNEMPNP
jgi:pilus assembly protein Flp/PilA